MIDAAILLRSLRGEALRTKTGKENSVLDVDGNDAMVATSRSPHGQRVPIAWLQDVLDRLRAGESITVTPSDIRYRSSFLSAVLLTLPMVEVRDGPPAAAQLKPGYSIDDRVLQELEHRLDMYGALLDRGGPTRVEPSVLRELGIYGGASGIWNDVSRTRGIGGAASVTVAVLHTGRHYPDDLSDEAVLYHYPATGRPPGRDQSEVEATKAARRLGLPVFLVLQEGARRSVRKGWVATWDDDERLFLIEFGAVPTEVERGDTVDEKPFELFEDRRDVFRRTRGRPNQQRFRIQVIQRYGGTCAVCDSPVSEWLIAAHLVGDAERGSSDPRNGLLLCTNHHTAFDNGLIAFDPQDTRIHVRGYTAAELNFARRDLSHLRATPAREALKFRWDQRATDGWAPAN